MSGKTKWLAIYLGVGFIPVFIWLYFFLNPAISIPPLPAVHDFLIFAPYIGLGLITLLGWQINQTRIFWSAVFLFAFYWFLLNPGAILHTPWMRMAAFQIIGTAFPLALCVLFLIKESRLWSDKSLARLLLFLFPFVLFLCMAKWTPDVFYKILYWNPSPTAADLSRLPNLTGFTLFVFLLVVFFIPDLKIQPFLVSLAAALAPFLVAVQTSLGAVQTGTGLTEFNIIVSYTALTAILLHSILHMYWKKVYVDILTGVPNRQALDERLHTLTRNFSLAMVDIDHFKKFNDSFGHAEGDNALRMVAQHLEEHLGFRVYRYGGEEFCVVFEEEDFPKAVEMMDKARASLETRKFRLRRQKRQKGEVADFFTRKPTPPGKGVTITISVGVASAGKKLGTYEEVIKQADQALYQAKDKGRNRVVANK